MKQISGNKLLVKALKEEGVEYLFGYPGACTIDISDELYKQDDVKIILPRHEQALVHEADAYARTTGKVGVCLVTSGPGATNTITGIAGKKGFAAINIEKDMMNSEIGFCRKVLEEFDKNGISIEHMPSGIDTMTIFVHKDEFEEKEQQVLAGIHKAVNPDHIELESDLALIAIVGRGMRSTRGTAGRIFSALAHAHINVKMIDQGSSELNIIVGVRHDDFKNAIRALYQIFVETQI